MKQNVRSGCRSLMRIAAAGCFLGTVWCSMDGMIASTMYLRLHAEGVPALWDESLILAPLYFCLLFSLGGFLYSASMLIPAEKKETRKTESPDVEPRDDWDAFDEACRREDRRLERKLKIMAAATRWIVRLLGAAYFLWGLGLQKIERVSAANITHGMDIFLMILGTALVVFSGKLTRLVMEEDVPGLKTPDETEKEKSGR